MAEHKRAKRELKEEPAKEHQRKTGAERPPYDQLKSYDKGCVPGLDFAFDTAPDRRAEVLAKLRSDTERADFVIQLQQSYGNRCVQRLIESMAAQAKLTVNAPSDGYEHEADEVADVVTKAATSQAQRQVAEEEQARMTPLPQREKEEEIRSERLGATITPLGERQPGNSFDAASELESRLIAQKGSGSPLPAEVRTFMEPRFGVDFGDVRVHTGGEAAKMNRELGAQAFTLGQDIYIGPNDYVPGTDAGKRLLAHELTHVVQQTGGSTRSITPLPSSIAGMVSLGTVQRKPATGLAAAVVTTLYAKDAYAFWKDKANKDKPLKDLSDFLMKKVNEKLPYPCKAVYSTSGTAGAFDRTTWTIEMNTADFSQRPDVSKVGDLDQGEVAEVVDTIYHEARHAEQAFRIAQMQAEQGKTAEEIEKGLSIPAEVAAVAAANPLKGAVETKGWEPFTGGRYEKYVGEVAGLRDEINDMRGVFGSGNASTKITKLTPKINKIETHLNDFFAKEKDKIEKIADKDKESVDKSVLKHVKEIRSAFDELKTEFDKQQKGDPTKYDIPKLEGLALKLHQARYAAYRDYEDEKDAWAAGAAAAAAFKKQAKK